MTNDQIKVYENKNLELINQYMPILDEWLAGGCTDKTLEDKMTTIRSSMDHIVYGINYQMITEQMKLRNSNIQLV